MKDGVPDSFHEIVDAYYQRLFRFALSLTRDEHEACDLTQQTFTIYAEKRETLRDTSKVKSWLFTTLYREFLRQKRKSHRSESREPEKMESSPSLADTPDLSSLDHPRILAALGQLEDIYQAPLSLYYLQSHSYLEIAEIIGVPIGTIMSRLSRGKTRLKQIFLESGEF